jgi:hypothetical protein
MEVERRGPGRAEGLGAASKGLGIPENPAQEGDSGSQGRKPESNCSGRAPVLPSAAVSIRAG